MFIFRFLNSVWQFIKQDAIVCGIIANIIFLCFTTNFVERKKENKALNVLKNELETIYNKYYAMYCFLLKFFIINENDTFSYDSKIQHCKHNEEYIYFLIPHQFYSNICEINNHLIKIKDFTCCAFLSEDVQFIITRIDKEMIFLKNFACTVIEGIANAKGGIYNSVYEIKNDIQLIKKSAKTNKIVITDNDYYDLSNDEVKQHRQQIINFNNNNKANYETKCTVMNGPYMVHNEHCGFE